MMEIWLKSLVASVPATAATTYLVPVVPFPTWFHYTADGHFTLDANAPLGNNYFYCKYCMTNAPGVCTPTIQIDLNILGLRAVYSPSAPYTNDVYLNKFGKLPDGAYFNVLDLIEECQTTHPAINEVILSQIGGTNDFILIDPSTGDILPNNDIVPANTYTMTFHVCLQNNQNNCVDNTVVVYVSNSVRMANATTELDTLNVTIAPNPSDSIFNINLGEIPTEEVILEVYNPVGQKVYTGSMTKEQTHELQLNSLSSGTYILKITYKDQVIKKMLIKH